MVRYLLGGLDDAIDRGLEKLRNNHSRQLEQTISNVHFWVIIPDTAKLDELGVVGIAEVQLQALVEAPCNVFNVLEVFRICEEL